MSAADQLTRIIGGVLERFGVRFYTIREFKVESQNADGSLELKAIDERDPLTGELKALVPGLSNVPIWQLTPGSSIKVPNGAFCLVGFRQGNPQNYVALCLWSGQTCQQMILAANDLQLGGSATEAAMLGTSYRADETAFLTALQGDIAATDAVIAAAAAGALDPSVKAAFVKIKTLFLNWQAQIAAFEGKKGNHTSTVVKVKK